MSCVFQNIDPPPPLRPASVNVCGGGHTRLGERGINILEDAKHSSVLYLYRILFDQHSTAIIGFRNCEDSSIDSAHK
jgi:hypothetical protein